MAIQQPIGTVSISYHDLENYYYNSQFNLSLNLHDEYYYTKDSFQIANSFTQFCSLIKKYDLVNIIDIGCGQGEYVANLNKLNINAIGYDPTLRVPSSNLIKEYFNPDRIDEKSEKTFVMRCVLPHIPNPFSYINSMFSRSPKSKVYLEFQRLEFILEHKAWNSISHEHVNYFTIEDFQGRFNIIDSGVFSEGEWGFVLLSKAVHSSFEVSQINVSGRDEQFRSLFETRSHQLLKLMDRDGTILIYGAAGKGINFCHAYMTNGGGEIFAIDSDSERQGKYLECSGVEVISPLTALQNFDSDTLILVMNKNHLEFVKKLFGNRSNIYSLSSYLI